MATAFLIDRWSTFKPDTSGNLNSIFVNIKNADRQDASVEVGDK